MELLQENKTMNILTKISEFAKKALVVAVLFGAISKAIEAFHTEMAKADQKKTDD